jgi:hypothetical protein
MRCSLRRVEKMDKPINEGATRKANPIMSKSVMARLKTQTGKDFDKPIINIYLSPDEVAKLHYGSWGGVDKGDNGIVYAAANHAAKQIVEFLEGKFRRTAPNRGSSTQFVPFYSIDESDWKALREQVGAQEKSNH